MKKLLISLIAVILVFSVTACANNSGTTESEATSSAPTGLASTLISDIASVDEPVSEIISVISIEPVVEKENLSKIATTFGDENANHVDGFEYSEDMAIDGDISTAWQKDGNINAGDGGTWDIVSLYGEEAEIFIGLEWTEEKYIGKVVVMNDPGNVMETPENGGYKLSYLKGEEWVEVENLVDERSDIFGLAEVTITFDPVNTTKIKLNVYKGISGGKHSPKIYELEVYEADETAGTESDVESDETVVSEADEG